MCDLAFVVCPGCSITDLGVIMAFEAANSVADVPPYSLHFVSETGGSIRTGSGMMLESEPFTKRPYHTLFLGGATTPQAPTPGLIAYVQGALERHRRIAAISTGAFVLAEAGLLDGRQATTHWMHVPPFRRRFPAVRLEPDRIFTRDGQVWTTAGGAAGLDLGLALIENDLGADVARSVARKLVIYHRRTGAQPQVSKLLELAPKADRIQAALTFARDNLHRPLAVAELARAACLSPRQFSRAFLAETGHSPGRAIEMLRVEWARDLIEQSRHSIDTVARQTGFSDRDHMRRAFMRAFGQSPQALRRMARLVTDIHASGSPDRTYDWSDLPSSSEPHTRESLDLPGLFNAPQAPIPGCSRPGQDDTSRRRNAA